MRFWPASCRICHCIVLRDDTAKSMLFRPFAITLILAGCSQSTPSPGSDKFVFTGDETADWGQIIDLELEAKALLKIDGCRSAKRCVAAPVGSRACGGPRFYVVYCAERTDSVALFRKLDAVAAAEREFNVRYNVGSTCELVKPGAITRWIVSRSRVECGWWP